MLSLIAVVTSGLVACTGQPDARAAKPRPATHTVTMEAVGYKPEVVTANVGDAIVWVNKDPYSHTATASGTFDSKEMLPDKSFTFTATTPGEVHYVCTFHPTMK
jgi:plastocyanin